ncbi:MAG TPA: hypothetical protein VLJ68_11490 [Chitinophagaceae bacterium]|nr:hypothetical protein [Chitinophagaceae bacterium]
MTLKRLRKKFFKVLGIILGSLLILATALHFWLVNHAEEIIQNLVESKSNGQIKLKVESFRFNWFSTKIELRKAVFYTTDTATATSSYRFAVKKIKLQVKSIFPLIFRQRLLIKLLDLDEPDITVTQLRASTDTSTKKDFSIPQEMGRIYNSIQYALEVLQVKRFEITNARFNLINKLRPEEQPVTITNIDFHMENLRIDSSQTGKEKIFFSDNVVLKSRDQDILFPDKRHRLSFSKFRINIDKKLVEFDSCTVAAIKTDSSGAAFSVFFDKLMMTNIDFDTLYRNEVIKADSVFALNPKFKLDIDRNRMTAGSAKVPQLDKIIQQLTGDLLVNFVVVNNADFAINVKRDGVPSSFTSQGNNFEMQGLRIDGKAEKPMKIKSFAMAIRHYENFLKDSSYALVFDSILFNNDHIMLHDFSLRQLRGGGMVNDLKVSRFELVGLSWDNLLFEKKLVAREATLFEPSINYEIGSSAVKPGSQTNIFLALGSINDFLMLEKLRIIRGQIDLVVNKRTELHLKNATMSVHSRELLGSHQLKTIRQSIDHLESTEGTIKNETLSVGFKDIYFTGGDSRFKAASMYVMNKEKSLDASASNINLDEVFVDEKTGNIRIDGVQWDQAHVKLSALPAAKDSANKASIQLTHIKGGPTEIDAQFGTRALKTTIQHVAADEFLLVPGTKPVINNLDITGRNITWKDTVSRIQVNAYEVKDKQSASFQGLQYEKITKTDSILVSIPQVSFYPDIRSVIEGATQLDNIKADKPSIRLRIHEPPSTNENNGSGFLPFRFGSLVLTQPDIEYEHQDYKGTVSLKWDGRAGPGNMISITGARIDSSTAALQQVDLTLNHFLFTGVNGNRFDAKKGEVIARLNDIRLERRVGEDGWQGKISLLDMKQFVFDSLGKHSGTLKIETAGLNDLDLSSETIRSMRSIVEKNSRFRISKLTGEYIDSNNLFRWFNANYDQGSRSLLLDSFHYKPTPSKEAFAASHAYPLDYLNAKTGKISIGPIDLDKYLKDSVLSIGTIRVNDLDLNDYRDNRKPRQQGVIKPLPVGKIKALKMKFSIDSLLFDRARTVYTELSPKTGKAGEIPITNMTVKLFPIRNYDLQPTDSLRIQAMGYLMDSIWVRLRMRESYLDSLSGFLFTLRMKPADMRVLNPILIPLTSAKLNSGYLDTLSLRVAGTEYIAFGDMLMFYHNLKVTIYKDRHGRNAKFCDALLNFIANTFIFRNDNTRRTGHVYFERDRNRGPLNYLIRISMNGVTNTISGRNSRQLLRLYKKELLKRHLPPVDYD